MQRKHIFLPDKQLDQLKKISEQTGLKTSEIIRRAIEEFFHTTTVRHVSTAPTKEGEGGKDRT
jgi:predicted DNA-binding protein